MASLIVIPNPILRQKAKEVNPTSVNLTHLVDEMSRIRQENGGEGIAAPQLGESLRIINFMFRGREYTVFNPYIKNKKGAVQIVEGCLSIPDNIYSVKRPQALRLFGEDIHGNPIKLKADVYEAHPIEHEVDHLDGILIDKKGKLVGKKEVILKPKLAFGGEDGKDLPRLRS